MEKDTQTRTVTAKIPLDQFDIMQRLVDDGSYKSKHAIIREAVDQGLSRIAAADLDLNVAVCPVCSSMISSMDDISVIEIEGIYKSRDRNFDSHIDIYVCKECRVIVGSSLRYLEPSI